MRGTLYLGAHARGLTHRAVQLLALCPICPTDKETGARDPVRFNSLLFVQSVRRTKRRGRGTLYHAGECYEVRPLLYSRSDRPNSKLRTNLVHGLFVAQTLCFLCVVQGLGCCIRYGSTRSGASSGCRLIQLERR